MLYVCDTKCKHLKKLPCKKLHLNNLFIKQHKYANILRFHNLLTFRQFSSNDCPKHKRAAATMSIILTTMTINTIYIY